MQDNLRKEIKVLKALQKIPYYEIAEYLEIQKSSFYSWLYGNYDLSQEKEIKLKEIISFLSEV